MKEFNHNELVYDACINPDGAVFHIAIQALLPSEADAIAFAARFPKVCKLRAVGICGDVPKGAGYVAATIYLTPNDATGAKNEAGWKRFKSIRKACAKLGVKFTQKAGYGNSLAVGIEPESLEPNSVL